MIRYQYMVNLLAKRSAEMDEFCPDPIKSTECLNEIIRDHKVLYHYSIRVLGLNPLTSSYSTDLAGNILKFFLEKYWTTGRTDMDNFLKYDEYKRKSGDVVKHSLITSLEKSRRLLQNFVSTRTLREKLVEEWYRVLLVKERGLRYPRVSGYFSPDDFLRSGTNHKDVLLFFVSLNRVLEWYSGNGGPDTWGDDFISVLDKFYEKKYLYPYPQEPRIEYSHLFSSIENQFRICSGEECITRYFESLITNVINFSRHTWIKENISSWRDLRFLQSLEYTHDMSSGKNNSSPHVGTGIHLWGEMIRVNSLLNYLGLPCTRYSLWVIGDDRMYDLVYMSRDLKSGTLDPVPGSRVEFKGFIRNNPYWHPLFSLWIYPVYSPRILDQSR